MILSRWINVCRSFGVNKGCYIRAQSSYESSPGIIDGRAIAKALKNELKVQVAGLRDKHVIPGLAVILLGDRKDSATYVKMKQKACTQIGINSRVYGYPVSEPEEEILKKVKALNEDPTVHGILVQLPLPDHINEARILEALNPIKDVDGLHPDNMKQLLDVYGRHTGHNVFADSQTKTTNIPCTPLGCMEILDRCNVPIEGMEAVVVGRSNLVGIPAALLLMQRNATVTIAHSRTKNLDQIIKRADIVIVAVGRADMIKGAWIKPGAVVIDVGINSVNDPTMDSGYRLVGDVEFDAAKKVASLITPVPGGVGPMTIAMLLRNTVRSAMAASH